jgi:hypothetical protein
MNRRNGVRRLVLCTLVFTLAACGQPAATQPSATATETPTNEPTATTPGSGDAPAAHTYQFNLNVIEAGAAEFPAFEITVPQGWQMVDGWIVNRPRPDRDIPPVAVQFWDVDQVYGHPCQWDGTLFQPGPTVDDLANALVDVPMRNATEPIEVTIDGYAGMYLEWSVPADLEVIGDSEFPACDSTSEGHNDFLSWTGKGWGTDRFHQGAGQVDQLWILDIDGSRLVIDAFSMPYATAEERTELLAVVESIAFER